MYVLIFIISLLASFVFSLGGVGAAIILIPVLVSLGIPVNAAKPVGLFYNTVSLTGATVSNIKNKRLDFGTGIPIIVSSLVFAVAGAYVSKFFSGRFILILFTAFLLFSGFMFLFHRKKDKDSYRSDRPFLLLAAIGSVAGLLSGLLGIGGGGIISPLMLMSGFNPKKITAITAFVVPFSSFSGFLTYWAMGSVDWAVVVVASVAGLIGATAGTVFMQKKLDAATVKKILAIILLLMALKLILKIF